jgi:hypothetical protein
MNPTGITGTAGVVGETGVVGVTGTTTVTDNNGMQIGWQDAEGNWHWQSPNSAPAYDPNMPGLTVNAPAWQTINSWGPTVYPYQHTEQGKLMSEVE